MPERWGPAAAQSVTDYGFQFEEIQQRNIDNSINHGGGPAATATEKHKDINHGGGPAATATQTSYRKSGQLNRYNHHVEVENAKFSGHSSYFGPQFYQGCVGQTTKRGADSGGLQQSKALSAVAGHKVACQKRVDWGYVELEFIEAVCNMYPCSGSTTETTATKDDLKRGAKNIWTIAEAQKYVISEWHVQEMANSIVNALEKARIQAR